MLPPYEKNTEKYEETQTLKYMDKLYGKDITSHILPNQWKFFSVSVSTRNSMENYSIFSMNRTKLKLFILIYEYQTMHFAHLVINLILGW